MIDLELLLTGHAMYAEPIRWLCVAAVLSALFLRWLARKAREHEDGD